MAKHTVKHNRGEDRAPRRQRHIGRLSLLIVSIAALCALIPQGWIQQLVDRLPEPSALPALSVLFDAAPGPEATPEPEAATDAPPDTDPVAAWSGSDLGPESYGQARQRYNSAEARGLLASIPAYQGVAAVELKHNVPEFTPEELAATQFMYYAPQDSLGRSRYAMAKLGPGTLATEPRGSIGMIRPAGWHTVRSPGVEGGYVYNRCHLLGYQLGGLAAVPYNLITGTRYLNVEGMLPYENSVAAYIRRTGNHVLYRATPVYLDAELLARGVQLEAYSLEDAGAGICFNVFCYNVQPGFEIDYLTGKVQQENA